MSRGNALDRPLLIILLLLAGTLGAFAAGLFPYPFGVLVLSVLFCARLLVLAARRGGPG